MIGIDGLSMGSRSAVPQGVAFHQPDIGDRTVADIARREEAVAAVRFAALISVGESMERDRAYLDANLMRARRFFTGVAAAGIRGVVFSSTAAVCGDAGAGSVIESAPLAPAYLYGWFKRAAARVRQSIGARRGLGTVILRYFNVAGADPRMRAVPRPGAKHPVKIVSEAATGQRDRVVIYGQNCPTQDGTAVRDCIHVSDLSDVHLAAVRYLRRGGRSATRNCGHGKGHSVREGIEAAQRQAPFGSDVTVGGRRPGDVGSIVADASALRNRLDCRPRHADLAFMMRTAIEWAQRRVEGPIQRSQVARWG